MNMRRVAGVLVVAIGCALPACAKPPQLSPEARNLSVNDGRSVEHCTTLGTVSATLANVPIDDPVDYYLKPQLLNQAAERGANDVEAMPTQCSRSTPSSQSGVAYRCPDASANVDAKFISCGRRESRRTNASRHRPKRVACSDA